MFRIHNMFRSLMHSVVSSLTSDKRYSSRRSRHPDPPRTGAELHTIHGNDRRKKPTPRTPDGPRRARSHPIDRGRYGALAAVSLRGRLDGRGRKFAGCSTRPSCNACVARTAALSVWCHGRAAEARAAGTSSGATRAPATTAIGTDIPAAPRRACTRVARVASHSCCWLPSV